MLSLKDRILSNFQRIQILVAIVENLVALRNTVNASERIKDAIKTAIVPSARIANLKKTRVLC